MSAHTLTTAELPHQTYNVTDPGHTHAFEFHALGATAAGTFADQNTVHAANAGNTTSGATTGISIADTNGGGGHTHTFNLGVGYLDFILCQKT